MGLPAVVPPPPPVNKTTLNIRFSREQSRIHRCQARHRVVVAGRRGGKTFLGTNSCFLAACDKAIRGDIRYVAPTREDAKELAWDRLKNMFYASKMLDRKGVGVKSEGMLRLRLKNGRIVRLFGGEAPDRLRGKGVGFIVLDEYAAMDKKVWNQAVEPSLADTEGRALFISTPSGFNHLYDLYMDALMKMKKGSKEWAAFQYTTAQGGFVKPEIIAAARENNSPRDFRQEYEASFEALSGRVYYSFDRTKNVMPVEDNGTLLLVGMDFNVSPMTCTLSVRAGTECHTFGEIVVTNSNTQEMCTAIRQKFPSRNVLVYPDPTADSRHTNAPIGETDITILRRHGFQVFIPTKGFYPIADKYNTVNALLENANHVRRLKMHPDCKNLIKGFDGLCYKEDTKIADKEGGLDHITDAEAYMVCGGFPMVSINWSQQEVSF